MPNGGPLRMGHSAPPNKRMQLAGARAVGAGAGRTAGPAVGGIRAHVSLRASITGQSIPSLLLGRSQAAALPGHVPRPSHTPNAFSRTMPLTALGSLPRG
jgi:hypothetical protein